MNYVSYIVYGLNDGYFLGAKFSIISLFANTKETLEVVVLTDRPDYFAELPVRTLELSEAQKKEWSLNGQYHFRIKNRGLAYIIDSLQLNSIDRVIAIDTDTYFSTSITPVFDRLNKEWSTIFRNEGAIREKRRFSVYVEALEGRSLITPKGKSYQMSENAEMWGTLLWGFEVSNRSVLDHADDIMLCLLNHVDAHTIEPFSLTEAIKSDHRLFESKDFVEHYSTSGKKRHALAVLEKFFESHRGASFAELKAHSKQLKLSRNMIQLLRSRYERHIQKL